MKRNFLGPYAALYALALLSRLAAAFLVPLPPFPHGDTEYLANARALLDGTYTDTFKPPLYSLLLLPGLLIGGSGASLYAWQAVLFSFNLPLSLLLYRTLGFGRRATATGLALEAFYPYFLFTFTQLGETGAGLILLKLVLIAWIRWRKGSGIRKAFLFGAAAGTFTLLRPNAWSVIGCMALLSTGGFRRGPGRWLQSRLFVGVGLAVTILPWALHTRAVVDRTLILPTNGGYNFVVGHNPYAVAYLETYGHTSMEDVVIEHPDVLPSRTGTNPLTWDRLNYQRGFRFVRTHWGQEARMLLLKLRRYFDWRLEPDCPMSKQLAYSIPFAVLLIGAIGGVAAAGRRRASPMLWLFVLEIVYAVPYLIYFPCTRMRMISDMFLIVLAAYGAGSVRGRELRLGRPSVSPHSQNPLLPGTRCTPLRGE